MEHNPDDSVGLSDIEAIALLQLKHRMDLEVSSGLSFRTSTLAATNRILTRMWPDVKPFRTKKQAKVWLDAVHAELMAQVKDR